MKKKKQKLIDRINRCKTLKELDKINKTLSYYKVLSEDEQWDYEFFFDLIEFKLIKMRDYFWTHNIVENEKRYGNICDTLIKILRAGYKTNIIMEDELKSEGIYVNTRNVHRFISTYNDLNFLKKEGLKKYYCPAIREAKAKALFWKYLERHIEELWD